MELEIAVPCPLKLWSSMYMVAYQC